MDVCIDPHAITPIDDGTGKRLVLYHHDADFRKLLLIIVPHGRLEQLHDQHIVWRDGENAYRLDGGAFTISTHIDDSMLDEHFTAPSAPGETNKTESSEALQWAQRLYNASRTFFKFFWLVDEGEGVIDQKGRKIPPYGVYVGIEARIAEYLRDTEEKLLGVLGVDDWPADVLNLYRDALEEMRDGYKKWEIRGNSGANKDDLWNNPHPKDLSAAIEAIDKRLGEVKNTRNA